MSLPPDFVDERRKYLYRQKGELLGVTQGHLVPCMYNPAQGVLFLLLFEVGPTYLCFEISDVSW